MEIERDLKGDLVAESHITDGGAPIADGNKIVEVGNTRGLAIKRACAAKSAKATEYKQWLIANAERFGLDPNVVSGMKEPILYRERTTPLTQKQRLQFVDEANSSSVNKLTARDRAKVDARVLDGRLFSLLKTDEAGNLTGASTSAHIQSERPARFLRIKRNRQVVKGGGSKSAVTDRQVINSSVSISS